MADRPLVRSQQPALQRNRLVHSDACSRRPFRKTMPQRLVAQPAVLAGSPTPVASAMRMRPSPEPLSSYCNQRLTLGLPAANALFLSAPVSLIDLDYAGQPLPPWSTIARLSLCTPSGLVTAQSQNALDPVLLRDDVPHRPEPEPQRLAKIAGALPPAAGALNHTLRRPGPLMAARTAESVRPAQGEQIVATGFFGGETRLELKQIARVILHEATYYILGSPESSGYPT